MGRVWAQLGMAQRFQNRFRFWNPLHFGSVFALFAPFFEQTCLNMIFRRGGWGLNWAWLKGSGTGFGFEIRPIFGPNLRCSRQFAPILLISATPKPAIVWQRLRKFCLSNCWISANRNDWKWNMSRNLCHCQLINVGYSLLVSLKTLQYIDL